MIPPNLDAFRQLMQRVANVRAVRANDDAYAMQLAATSERERHAIFAQQLAGPRYFTTLSPADRSALEGLATATPEQLLGIVGKVDAELYCDLNRVVYHITPREGA